MDNKVHFWTIQYNSHGLLLRDSITGGTIYYYECSFCKMPGMLIHIDNKLEKHYFNNVMPYDVDEIVAQYEGMSCKDWMLKSVLI